VAEFRRTQLPSRERIRNGGLEFHRHYVGSTACVPSRATLFTGQYPSLHGVSQTSGIAKQSYDPAAYWLDPDEVPTMGDWFRAAGYQTHYRGKWHVRHADLLITGTHEAIHVPFVVRGPGVASAPAGITVPTSHVDLIPNLMGLADIDVERAAAGVAEHHTEAHPLPGRDSSDRICGRTAAETVAAPVYFMTEDDMSRGQTQTNMLTGASFEAVEHPSLVESVITTLPTAADGGAELWKINHYYERLDDWNAANGIAKNPFAPAPADSQWEMHNLTTEPEERKNQVGDDPTNFSRLQSILDEQRDAKRLLPTLRNQPG